VSVAGKPGASMSGTAGVSGGVNITTPEPPEGAPNGYPAPFGASMCPDGPPPVNGAQECVTLDQLIDDDRRLSVIGGFEILGTLAHWRCPTIAELMADSGCSGGEGCCMKNAYCGPLEQRSSQAASGGASGHPGDGSGGVAGVGGEGPEPRDEHECCYYIVTACGV